MAPRQSRLGGERRVDLARDPRSIFQARHFVDCVLRRRRLSERARESAVLVSSELVTNAYRHGEGEIELRVGVLDDRVRIEVIDEGRHEAPPVRSKRADGTGGWGLRIVDELALDWGVFEGATHVWADLARI